MQEVENVLAQALYLSMPIQTLEVLAINTTSTAEYAAVAANTCCFVACVKMEHEAEKSKVKMKTVRIW